MTVQTPLWPFVPSARAVDITHAKGCILHTRGGGEIRGEGLLRGIEIVKDRETLERFPESTAVTQRVIGAASSAASSSMAAAPAPSATSFVSAPPSSFPMPSSTAWPKR